MLYSLLEGLDPVLLDTYVPNVLPLGNRASSTTGAAPDFECSRDASLSIYKHIDDEAWDRKLIFLD